MKQERWLAIVNPKAGRGALRAAAIVQRLQLRAERVVLTEGAGHATELAANADGFSGIIAAGGDGTIFEVLQGINGATHNLMVHAAGRGNTLARDLTADARRIDLLQVDMTDAHGNTRRVRSGSTVATGYPCTVAEMADARFHFLGSACYGAAGLLTVPQQFAATVSYDDGAAVRGTFTGLLANNSRFVANFRALPRASVTDGVFDVMELRRGLFGQIVHNVSAMTGLPFEPVRPIQAETATVACAQPRTLVVDGEFYRDVASFTITVLPAALNCSRLR